MLIWSALLDKKKNATENFMYFFWKVLLLSRVRLFATPWAVTRRVPLSMEFSRQEYWSGLPFPTPEDFSTPGIKPGSPILQADFFFFKPLSHQGSPSMRETQALLSAHLFQSAQLQCLIVFTLGLFLLFSSLGCHF